MRRTLPDIERIQDQVDRAIANHYQISVELIRSPWRCGDKISRARFVAYYVFRKRYHLPLKQIGGLYAGRHHTTIMHGIREAERLINEKKLVVPVIHRDGVPVKSP